MIDPAGHLGKARRLLDQARYLLAGGFNDGAGRDAYMAGLHAALAYVVLQTGKEPKTHSGARSEFARLARADQRIDKDFVTFLGRGFALKVVADYDDGDPLGADETQRLIAQASSMIESVATLLLAVDDVGLRATRGAECGR